MEDASACVDDILARGKLPIVVGGTGLYLDALVAGRSFAAGGSETRSRQRLNERLAREGIEPLYRELSIIDPTASLHGCISGMKNAFSAPWRSTMKPARPSLNTTPKSKLLPPRYDAVYIGLTLKTAPTLRALIDARVDAMPSGSGGGSTRITVRWRFSLVHRPTPSAGKELLGALRGEKACRSHRRNQTPLPPVRQASAHLAAAKQKAIHWIFWKKERGFSPAPFSFRQKSSPPMD